MARSCEITHQRQQQLSFLVRQHRRRLIKDQDLGAEGQGLENFDPLTLSDRQLGDWRVELNAQANPLQYIVDVGVGFRPSRGCARSQAYIFAARKWHDQFEMLMNHAYPERLRGGGGLDLFQGAIHLDCAGVSRVNPSQNIHQCRFSGAIFPKQSMHFALTKV